MALTKREFGEIIVLFEKKKLNWRHKKAPYVVLGFVSAQNKDKPTNIKLRQPKAWLKGAGLHPQSFTAEMTFTVLFGQDKLSQANFSINQYFKSEEAPNQRSDFQGVI